LSIFYRAERPSCGGYEVHSPAIKSPRISPIVSLFPDTIFSKYNYLKMQFKFAAVAALFAISASAQVSPVPHSITDTFAPVATSGVPADRTVFAAAGSSQRYQIYYRSQPGGYASIPGALTAANSIVDGAAAINAYNANTKRAYTAVAALFTTFDKKIQLFWKADGHISPRSDSDYLITYNG
jgi:hypothetical protein